MAFRLKCLLFHLVFSILLAVGVSLLVYGIWYPPPFTRLSGGLNLVGMLLAIDIALGPLLTFVVAKATKPHRQLTMDLCIIGALQLGALAYGLHVLSQARPVAIVFEVDRFRMVAAVEVDTGGGALPTAETMGFPLFTGPRMYKAEKPRGVDEILNITALELQGRPFARLAHYWVTYSPTEAWNQGKSVSVLMAAHPSMGPAVGRMAESAGLMPENLRYLPIQSRTTSWLALVSSSNEDIIGVLPVDGFTLQEVDR
jgi:hypothetical protein